MNEVWEMFFAPGTRVVALPGWRKPRLYLPAEPRLGRWSRSRLYPASLVRARMFRAALRLSIVGRRGRSVGCDDWMLEEFVRESLPEFRSAVVLVGTPGPAQKITAQLRDAKGRAIGYLKYAEKERARVRLRRERRILDGLPAGTGPEVFRFGDLGDGEAMLCSALQGDSPDVKAAPPHDLASFAESLLVSGERPLEDHPGLAYLPEGSVERCFEILSTREWKVVIRHGDFAPWNIIRSPGGILGAIDWEYGDPQGLPFLDLAYYVLQTSALIHRRRPGEALRRSREYLTHLDGSDLGGEEAEALTRLAAYDAYLKSREDGQSDDVYLQRWRRAVWEVEPWHA